MQATVSEGNGQGPNSSSSSSNTTTAATTTNNPYATATNTTNTTNNNNSSNGNNHCTSPPPPKLPPAGSWASLKHNVLRWRGSRKLVLVIVAIALLLDNMLLTVVDRRNS
uniref:Uncharacterized protein n=1 Tax=Anopheles albimanus TaxID=7167 RepID=A0A182FQV9_ANOAL